MTIRLLGPYDGFDANSIIDKDSATEAGLVTANQATYDLTGGVRRWRAVSSSNVPVPQPQVPQDATVNVGEQVIVQVPVGYRISAYAAAGAQGTIELLNSATGASEQKKAIASGVTRIGPFAIEGRVRVTSAVGSITTRVTRPGGKAASRSQMIFDDSIAQRGTHMPLDVLFGVDPDRVKSMQTWVLPNVNARGLFISLVEVFNTFPAGSTTLRYEPRRASFT